jgi:hypothetical protein
MVSRTPDTPEDVVADGRDETADERADRNWIEVLQELRVVQTGTQILAGFLLALAFQPAFVELSDGQRIVYLTLVGLAALSAVVALAPVSAHRALFGRRVKPSIVRFGNACMVSALGLVSALLVGVVAFVFDLVGGRAASWVAGAVLALVIVALWVAAPVLIRRGAGRTS